MTGPGCNVPSTVHHPHGDRTRRKVTDAYFRIFGTNQGRAGRHWEHVADTLDAARAALRREQVFVTKIDALKGRARARKAKRGKAVPAKNLAIFTRQFSVMIDAGLPLVQCFEILGKQEEDKNFAEIILATRADVEGGSGLADAMRKHPEAFDSLYANMMAAEEAGGILDTSLKRLATYIEKNVKLKGQVKAAMTYPIAVVSIAAILWKVIPTFTNLFAGLGATLPLPTRIVIALSNSLVSYMPFVIVGGVAVMFAFRQFYATGGGTSYGRRGAAQGTGARRHPNDTEQGRRLLRRGNGHGRGRHADADGADHDRISGRGGRRHRHRDGSAHL